MTGQVGMIGLKPDELECVRSLVRLLRHQDKVVSELARQALAYLELLATQPPRRDSTQVAGGK